MTKNKQSEEISRPDLSGIPVNKTTSFILPALNLSSDKTSFKLLKYFGLVNCYISHKQGIEEDPSYLFMVFNPKEDSYKKFHKFYEIYKTYPNFVKDYIIDKNLIMIVFKIKSKWVESFEYFKRSKYSLMSKEYAELFKRPDFATGKVRISKEYYVIHKHKDLKTKIEEDLEVRLEDSWELLDPLDLSKEIFSYERDTIKIQPSEEQC